MALDGKLLPSETRREAHSSPVFRLQIDPRQAQIPFLSWDTENGEKSRTNLLRASAPLILRFRIAGAWIESPGLKGRIEHPDQDRTVYHLPVGPGAEIKWTVDRSNEHLNMRLSSHGPNVDSLEEVQILLPFDPQVTPTTVLPKAWLEQGRSMLPVVVSSPDFGQILLDASKPGVQVILSGSRDNQTVDMTLAFPKFRAGDEWLVSFAPVRLAPPTGMKDSELWRRVRRGWFNTWQPSSQWGDQGRAFSAPAGVLANNVISDPVSFALPFYADQAFWTPEAASGISVIGQIRHTIDWWLDHRTDPTGEVVGYWDYRHFLDANPGILTAAWDYVESTGDLAWLEKRIDRLEMLSAFLERRDVDGDGMVEATQTGNDNTLIEPARSCCWWDALNCGHKDGYTNALIYRAWRCLADLESKLGRREQELHVSQLADRLKASYFKTLYNPASGWLAWWRSADGHLHDYATPIVNGLAIEYGLVEPNQGREILARLRHKMEEVNFTRFDLGLPCTLDPVRRADYLQPSGLGVPQREDGGDTFQNYMNGGISAGHSLHFIMAYHVLGKPERGDELLEAMLKRQNAVGFQNGVQNRANRGVDWTNWKGEPKGYEGYLADVFIFLQAAVLREPEMRARFYRPLNAQ